MSEAAAAVGLTRLLSDERLTRRAVSGDDRAFAVIFRRYHQGLFRYCLAIIGNREDAQDALQNTMIKVMRALPGEEREIERKPWLYRIAHTESIDLLRRRRETRQLDVEQVAPGYGLAEDAATRERLRLLLADLRELPERQREVLVMRELSGLDFEEIGAALETSGAVARQTLYEARQSLHQMEEGREMSCDVMMQALSDGDGRVARRRDVRAHLRSCSSCRRFRDEIKSRQHDLAALAPLPAVAAAGMLQGVLGGSQIAGSSGLAAALGGGAAKTVGASVAAKGGATVAGGAAVGVGAADRTGVINLGLPGEGGAKSGKETPGSGAGSEMHLHGKNGVQDSMPAGAAGAHGKAAPSGGAGQAPGQAKGHAGGSSGKAHASPAAPGEHATGKGHDRQPPGVAADGQETAAGHKPPAPESSTGKEKEKEKGEATLPASPSESDQDSAPKESPELPPAVTPEMPPQAPEMQPKAGEAPAPAPSTGPGKSDEHGKAPERKP